jgi:DNA-binding winged helix-turn-helix (wHTH) protein/ActR/RegA family two-component response regulator
LQIGEWRVHADRDELERNGARVKLEPLTMRLLLALAAQPGAVVPTEHLMEMVWPDVVVCQSSLYQAIAQLRRALGDEPDNPAYIVTVPRRGYRLIAAVSSVAAPAPAAAMPATDSATDGGACAAVNARPVPRWRAAASWKRPLGGWQRGVLAGGGLLAVTAVSLALVPVSNALKTSAASAQHKAIPSSMQYATTTRHVLWVDDRPENNVRERRSLEAVGIQVSLARSTEEALGWLQRERADVVISDMGRPPDHSAGYTLLDALRARNNTSPYLIYTASCSPAQDAEARERGALICTDKVAPLLQHVMVALQSPPMRVAGDETGQRVAEPNGAYRSR